MECPCGFDPRVDARSWYRWKKFRLVDRKKIQTIGTDLIFTLLTLCDIALWKCGLWEKFPKIRFGEDRWSVYAVPIRGWMPVVDSVEKSSGLLIGKKSRPSEPTELFTLLTLCDIALWKCGLWEKFQKIRFGRDRWSVHAVPIRGWVPVVDSVEKNSGLLIGKKSRPSELTEFWSFWHYVV